MATVNMAVSKNWGPLFGSPYKKSPTAWGSILGPLIFGIPRIMYSRTILGMDIGLYRS